MHYCSNILGVPVKLSQTHLREQFDREKINHFPTNHNWPVGNQSQLCILKAVGIQGVPKTDSLGFESLIFQSNMGYIACHFKGHIIPYHIIQL